MPKIDPEKLPRHIAVIMDGNGRWAQQRSLPRVAGHQAGVESVRQTVETCRELGIPVLTLYAFSRENWQRPKWEVKALMGLLSQYLRSEIKRTEKERHCLKGHREPGPASGQGPRTPDPGGGSKPRTGGHGLEPGPELQRAVGNHPGGSKPGSGCPAGKGRGRGD